jgi:mono/diheme cytochrome c family protein
LIREHDDMKYQCFNLLNAISLVAAFLFSSTFLFANDDAQTTKFVQVVQPLLQSKCVSCHGPEKQEGGLRLDSLTAAKRGGDTGPAIIPGELAKSRLIDAVRFTNPDLQMPPKSRLSDREIEALEQWVKTGAVWPEPATVLFEDEPQFVAALINGTGTSRLIADDTFGGKQALGVTPLQRDQVSIPSWKYSIRERPDSGEFRFLRLAWKKRGQGSVMIELASNGQWPEAQVPNGRYVAGPNTTGWAAIQVSEQAPAEWTVVTIDLWKDLGNVTLTGIAPTCDQGDEAFFDSIILGPTVESLDAYLPGFGLPSILSPKPLAPLLGDAFNDANNPIRKIFRGERLDLWSLKKPVIDESILDRHGEDSTDAASHLAPEMIDHFIRKRMAEAGIVPSAQADRRTLIRRLSFDLTGLPPTPEDVRSFAEDSSPNAYEALVDRLLDSPRYGERWARHWLDVVRYADTEGFERDEFRPLAWQYRDYVIRSLNQDKPYDQFIREQLAGDELVNGRAKTAEEADRLIATGFLRLGPWDSTAPIFQEEARHRDQQLADLVNTTGSAFLGLTFSCCQCHDHKYDPLSQADHFRLRAFFAGVTPRNDLVIELADDLEEIAKQNAVVEDEAAPLKAEQSKLDKDKKEDQPQYEELARTIGEIEKKKRSPRTAMGATDSGAEAPATHLFYQGDFSQAREEVPPGFVSVLDPNPAAIEPPRADTTGRRLALANWIASSDNPWTARALVNRVWQYHCGVGLVATANDFGFSGARPTNPELLDWLAIAFINDGWSIKKLHRAIVCSATYRQSSDGAGDRSQVQDNGRNQEKDPENRLLWRQNVVRLDAETLRDSLLTVSGALKTADSGKPRWPHVPIDLLHAQPGILEAKDGGDGGRMQGWYEDPVEETDVRSVFLVRKRAMPIPFLQVFDLPDTTVSCARRDSTVVAPQALMLFNSPESIRFALILAERVAEEAGVDPGQRVETLFQYALCRLPDEKEKAICLDLLSRHADQHRMDSAGDRAELLALRDLCRAVLNLNEFMYVD